MGGFSKLGKSIDNTSGGVPARISSGISVFKGTPPSSAKVQDARRMALYEDHVLLTKPEYEPLRFLRAAASQAEKQCPHHKEGLGMCLHCNPPPGEGDE